MSIIYFPESSFTDTSGETALSHLSLGLPVGQCYADKQFRIVVPGRFKDRSYFLMLKQYARPRMVVGVFDIS